MNYPRFVYDDASFRAYHHLAPLPDDAKVVGFAVDQPNGDLDAGTIPGQLRLDLETEESEDLGLFGGSKWVRRLLRLLDKNKWRFLILVVWPTLSTAVTLWWLVSHRESWIGVVSESKWITGIGTSAVVLGFALAALLALGLAVSSYALGRGRRSGHEGTTQHVTSTGQFEPGRDIQVWLVGPPDAPTEIRVGSEWLTATYVTLVFGLFWMFCFTCGLVWAIADRRELVKNGANSQLDLIAIEGDTTDHGVTTPRT